MKTRNITIAAIAAASLAGVSAQAGTHMAAPSKPVKQVMQESCITGDIGFDVVSSYISKGILFENQGFIIQPYGIWNSYHDHRQFDTLNPLGTTGNWFEFDFQTGLTFNVDKFAISPYFKVYESPADVFPNTYAVGLGVSYDDKDLLGDFALHPYFLVELQLAETAGNGQRQGFGNANGQYYEVGITPAHSWGDLTLSLPIKGGFGSGDFYLGNRTFGFFSVGIDAAYALNFVPECLGKWSVHTGVTYVRLGGRPGTNNPLTDNRAGAVGLAPANFDVVNGGPGVADRDQVVFGGGLKVAF
jgi:hypothetical protein